MGIDNKKITLTDRLCALQMELTEVSQALLTAACGEQVMLEAWARDVRKKIAVLSGDGESR